MRRSEREAEFVVPRHASTAASCPVPGDQSRSRLALLPLGLAEWSRFVWAAFALPVLLTLLFEIVASLAGATSASTSSRHSR